MSPPYVPFTLALVLMVGIGLIEAVGMGIGHIYADTDADMDGAGIPLLGWLGLGNGLPILVWLVAFLGCFSMIGVTAQLASTAILGSPLGAAVAAGVTIMPALFANAFVSRGIARVFPAYESTIISAEDLLMRRGTILEGTARRGHPARAKVLDQHRQAHFVMVEPQYDADMIAAGQTALLVRKEGALFFGVTDTDPRLMPVN